jgi:integrase
MASYILNNREFLVIFRKFWIVIGAVMVRSSRGSVAVRAINGRLKLVWSYAGDRYYLALGFPDTPANRGAAELKARLIERDIALDAFDRSLKKYKPQHQTKNELTAVRLFKQFTKWKTPKLDPKTVEKYGYLAAQLQEFFSDRPVNQIYERDAEQFKAWLLERQKPITVQDRLSLLRACWRWGVKQGLVDTPVWDEVKLKVPPHQKPKPFNLDEVKLIIEAFRRSPYYKHYSDFVEFLFGTGCRTGEAIGLQWKHVSDDLKSCWIGEIVTRGDRKAVKTYRPRTVPLTPRLQTILSNRRPPNADPEALVFPAPEGGALDDNNFRNRPWKKVLETIGVAYRKPYISRSTLISHSLDQGVPVPLIAELTGHSINVIYRSYAGNVRKSQLPDILPPIEDCN